MLARLMVWRARLQPGVGIRNSAETLTSKYTDRQAPLNYADDQKRAIMAGATSRHDRLGNRYQSLGFRELAVHHDVPADARDQRDSFERAPSDIFNLIWPHP